MEAIPLCYLYINTAFQLSVNKDNKYHKNDNIYEFQYFTVHFSIQ